MSQKRGRDVCIGPLTEKFTGSPLKLSPDNTDNFTGSPLKLSPDNTDNFTGSPLKLSPDNTGEFSNTSIESKFRYKKVRITENIYNRQYHETKIFYSINNTNFPPISYTTSMIYNNQHYEQIYETLFNEFIIRWIDITPDGHPKRIRIFKKSDNIESLWIRLYSILKLVQNYIEEPIAPLDFIDLIMSFGDEEYHIYLDMYIIDLPTINTKIMFNLVTLEITFEKNEK
jgi:hypothetical protein